MDPRSSSLALAGPPTTRLLTDAAIKIAIVAERGLVAQNLLKAISDDRAFECVGCWTSGADVVRNVSWTYPQVVLIDVDSSGTSGLEAVTRIKAQMPSIEILALTTGHQPDMVLSALRAGASGYIRKAATPAELKHAVQIVLNGGAFLCAEIARRLVGEMHKSHQERVSVENLSGRECSILQLVCEGLENKEIARELAISSDTVRTHLKSVFKKLVVRTRTAAAMRYRDLTSSAEFTR